MKMPLPMPGILRHTMIHGHRIKRIKITVDFMVNGREAFTEAEISLEAMTDPAYVRHQIDASIEKFMVREGLKGTIDGREQG